MLLPLDQRYSKSATYIVWLLLNTPKIYFVKSVFEEEPGTSFKMYSNFFFLLSEKCCWLMDAKCFEEEEYSLIANGFR